MFRGLILSKRDHQRKHLLSFKFQVALNEDEDKPTRSPMGLPVSAVALLALLCAMSCTPCGSNRARVPPAFSKQAAGRMQQKVQKTVQVREGEGDMNVGEEATVHSTFGSKQNLRTGVEGWRGKAAERLGLPQAAVANKGAVAQGIKDARGPIIAAVGSQNLQCNVTMACHVCPPAAIRDEADYCLSTGWRQQVRCVNERRVEVEVRFESCEFLTPCLHIHTRSREGGEG